jgi:hypothetical protein
LKLPQLIVQFRTLGEWNTENIVNNLTPFESPNLPKTDKQFLVAPISATAQAFRLTLNTSFGDELIAEATIPLPNSRNETENETSKTVYSTYSLGRSVAEVQIDIIPTFLRFGSLIIFINHQSSYYRAEKEVYFDVLPRLPHGYLGLNNIDQEFTKAVQVRKTHKIFE